MDIPEIATFLMFNNQAEEAAKLCTSSFEDSEVITMAEYGEDGPGDPGTVQRSIFTLDKQVSIVIDTNSGTELPMNPVTSLFIAVKDTIGMERLFNGLKDEGVILIPKMSMPPYREFAWVRDKFGADFRLALPE